MTMQESHVRAAEQHALAHACHRRAVESALDGDLESARKDALRSKQHSEQAHLILSDALAHEPSSNEGERGIVGEG